MIRLLAFLALTVTGTVPGPSGTRVELVTMAGAPAVATQTDAAGRFTLEAPSSGIWRVVVRSPSPLQSPPLPVVEPLELPVVWAPFQPEAPAAPPPEPLALSGQVIDSEERKPIPGALVWASADPGAFVRTDAEGRFQLAAPGRRRFDLEVVAPGYLLKKTLVLRPQLVSRKIGTVALDRAGTIRGKVLDPKGRPLPGAAVTAQQADRAVTDPQGRFELRRLRPGQTYEVRASRAGSFPGMERATVPRELTLVLSPSRGARGKVQDPEGKPIAGAEALVPDTPAVQSDAQGVFSIPELPASEVELTVRRKGYAPAVFRARIPPGTGPANLGVVTLRPGATLTGRVVDSKGKPVPDGEVFLLDKPANPNEMERALKDLKPKAKTGADGGFSIEDLARGAPFHVVVRSPGFLIAQVRAVRPPTEKPVLIRLEPAASRSFIT